MIRYTKHAKIQMYKRNISSAQVLESINTGVRLVNKTDSNKWTYVDNKNKRYIVTSKCSTIVVTVFHKER